MRSSRFALFARLALLAGVGLSAGGCQGMVPQLDLERMQYQHHYLPYEAAPYFPDGRAMRTPPAHTVRRDAVVGDPGLTRGIVDGDYVGAVPLPVTRAVLERGHDRFDITCAACHGVRGDGDSEVAKAMEYRQPPSLIAPPISGYPPGRIFSIASEGYGLMPSYSGHLSVEDRWAVVAFVRTLQLSQSVPLDELPPALKRDAERALKGESK